MDSDLLVHMADVGVHCVGRDDELFCHVVRREAARDEHDDLRLAGGKGELLRQFFDALLLKRLSLVMLYSCRTSGMMIAERMQTKMIAVGVVATSANDGFAS